MPGPEEPTAAVLAAVIRAALDGIIVTDGAGRVLQFNPAAEAMFGRRRADVLGRSIGELIVPPHLRERHRVGMERYLAGHAPRVIGRRVEMEAMRADGSVFPIELAITDTAVGGERFFTASIRDLSDRTAAEAAIRASEARLSGFMRNAPVGMYLKDAEGRYLVVNPEMSHVFGRPPEAIVGRSAADLLAPAEAAMVQGYDDEVRRTGRATSVEEYLPGLDRYAWTLVVRFPIEVPGETGVHIGGFDIDITGMKRVEEELGRSREALYQSEKLKALGSLLAGVAHELNNPLAVVVGQALMLEEDAAGGPLAERARRIGRAAERCARIVRTFLAMARREAPTRRPVDLAETVRAALTMVDYGLRTAGIEAATDLAADLPSVEGDPDQLHQLVVNLLLNAQQALADHPPPRRIGIVAARSPEGVALEVADNGPGVPEPIRARIFEPFFTTKPPGAGTGIGLAFCHGVAESHGGRIELVDRGPGAVFRLTLPAGAPGRGAAADPAPGPAATEAPVRRALVVDDEPDVAETLAAMLARIGLVGTVTTSGEAARALLADADAGFDLVVCDLRMPGLDGRGLHAWLLAERPDLLPRLAFTTGDALGAGARQFLDAAGRPVLVKPFTPEAVAGLVAQIAPGDVP
jgi:two-component system NtrC family sensor kinase